MGHATDVRLHAEPVRHVPRGARLSPRERAVLQRAGRHHAAGWQPGRARARRSTAGRRTSSRASRGSPSRCSSRCDADLIFIVVTVAFFAIAIAYARSLDRIEPCRPNTCSASSSRCSSRVPGLRAAPAGALLMTAIGWLQIIVFFAWSLALTKPLGVYMYRVFEGERQPLPRTLGRVERGLLRLCGSRDPPKEQTWLEYTVALLGVQRARAGRHVPHPALPGHAAAQPAALPGVPAALAFNTAASFTTNTNWQAYVGRDDDELPHADGRARVAQLHVGRGRHRRRARGRARLDAATGPDGAKDARQLLGRSDPRASSTCCCRLRSSSRSCSCRRA